MLNEVDGGTGREAESSPLAFNPVSTAKVHLRTGGRGEGLQNFILQGLWFWYIKTCLTLVLACLLQIRRKGRERIRKLYFTRIVILVH